MYNHKSGEQNKKVSIYYSGKLHKNALMTYSDLTQDVSKKWL